MREILLSHTGLKLFLNKHFQCLKRNEFIAHCVSASALDKESVNTVERLGDVANDGHSQY